MESPGGIFQKCENILGAEWFTFGESQCHLLGEIGICLDQRICPDTFEDTNSSCSIAGAWVPGEQNFAGADAPVGWGWLQRVSWVPWYCSSLKRQTRAGFCEQDKQNTSVRLQDSVLSSNGYRGSQPALQQRTSTGLGATCPWGEQTVTHTPRTCSGDGKHVGLSQKEQQDCI